MISKGETQVHMTEKLRNNKSITENKVLLVGKEECAWTEGDKIKDCYQVSRNTSGKYLQLLVMSLGDGYYH